MFEEKYGAQIEAIKNSRRSPESQRQFSFFSEPTSEPAKNFDHRDINAASHEYVEVSRFNELPKQYVKSGQYDMDGNIVPTSLPSDIFEVSYDYTLYNSFRRIGSQFDAIRIPAHDIYGVPTAMSDKYYELAGNQSMQEDIDQINNTRSRGDVSDSNLLIRERIDLKRKERMTKSYGREFLESFSEEKPKPKTALERGKEAVFKVVDELKK